VIARAVPAVDAATAERFWARVDKNGPVPAHCPEIGPCWTWTGAKLQGSGYGKATLAGRTLSAHRVAFAIVNGPIPDGVDVLHHCDNRECVRSEPNGDGHLFRGDALLNAWDRDAKGRTAKGARHGRTTKPQRNAVGARNGRAKLSPQQVLKVRAMRASTGLSYLRLGLLFSVSEAQAIRICKGIQWGSVVGAEPQKEAAHP
jgi:hypothetical protein